MAAGSRSSPLHLHPHLQLHLHLHLRLRFRLRLRLHLHRHHRLRLHLPTSPPFHRRLHLLPTFAQVERQTEDGPCGRECKTLGMACEQLMEEGWEDSLSESLFGGEAAGELRETACREWSSACRKTPPKVDPSRRPGPPFRPFTEDERALEAYRTGTPAAPGVFQDEALRYALGIGPTGDSDDGAFAGGMDFDGGGFGSQYPGVGGQPLHEDLARMEAFVSSDET